MNKIQIILARADQETVVVSTAGYDIGRAPKFKAVAVAKALSWLKRGTQADLAKATAFATTEGYSVFTYPTSERNSLQLAKAAVLAKANA